MQKKFIALAMVVAVLVFMAEVPQSQANSNFDSVLNRQKAVGLIIENSTAMWDASENLDFAWDDYQEQVKSSAAIDTQKTSFYNPWTEQDENIYYDSITQMQLLLMKEFMPEQMKYVWEVRQKALTVTKNAMANTADSLFIGLYSTYQNKILAQKSLELANRVFEREQIRFEKGLITEMDLEEARLEVETQEIAIRKADRDYENINRQFNSLAGLPLDYHFDLVGTPHVPSNKMAISEEDAVKRALENRMEIWDIQRQLALVVRRMDVYRHKNVYTFHPQTKEDYQKALDQMEDLKNQLSEKEYSIEKEIRLAYQELKISYQDLELASLNLKKMKNQLKMVKNQYDSGLVPVSAVEQLEHAVNQLEYAVNMNTITTLNKQDQFSRAISTGPGY